VAEQLDGECGVLADQLDEALVLNCWHTGTLRDMNT
jgi:hypothetical protein